jgi:Brp/Blh family beta-carotene 15,15'-monooxygenase
MPDPTLLSSASLLAIAAILLMGVPHGGLDGTVARRSGWPSGTGPWILFHLAYLLLAAAVVALWWRFPLASLVVFLLISALHFGSSDIRHISRFNKPEAWLPLMAHGGLVVIAIPAFQSRAVEPLFAVLVDAKSSLWLLAQIDRLLLPWATCVFFYLIYTVYQPRWRGAFYNLCLLILLAFLLPPLVSFALYFCLWHSRNHMLRIWKSIAPDKRRRSAIETVVYSFLAYAAAALYFMLQIDMNGTAAFAPSMVQLTFIGLAALTVPHMLLIDFIHEYREEQQYD